MPVSDLLRSRVSEIGEGGQKALADSVGVSEATASRWVKGQLVPEEKWAPALASWLNDTEAQVLASISLARKQRQEAKTKAAESADVRELRQTIDELATRLRDVEAKLDAAERRRPGPGGSPGAGRSKR